MALIHEVVQPFAEHHVAAPAMVELLTELAAKQPQQPMTFPVDPALDLGHAGIGVDAHEQVRIGHDPIILGKPVGEPQVTGVAAVLLDREIQIVVVR